MRSEDCKSGVFMDEVCTCVYQVRAQLAGEAAGGKKVSVVEIGKTILRNEGPKDWG